jgi:Protein of unknown function (DUF4231)
MECRARHDATSDDIFDSGRECAGEHVSRIDGFAALAAIATGFLQLGKFHENWVRYRSTVGALQAIKLRYELGLPPFDGDDRHARLIEEAEKAILQEGAQWSAEIAGQAGDKAARTQQPVR